jgi:hypothetical protein
MADSQVPWGVEALSGKISEPAWKAQPSWYLIATDDKMIPPDATIRLRYTVVRRKAPPLRPPAIDLALWQTYHFRWWLLAPNS